MSATKVFGAAITLGVVGRWAAGKKALPSTAGVLEVLGALLLVSFMDKGKTEPVAKGLAWLFMAAVLLSDSSPLTGLAKAEAAAGNTAAKPAASGTAPIAPTVLPQTEINNYGQAAAPSAYTTRATNTPRRV